MCQVSSRVSYAVNIQVNVTSGMLFRDPLVTLGNIVNSTLSPFANITIALSVSLKRTFSLSVRAWEVKYITIKYSRLLPNHAVAPLQRSVSVPVHVFVTGCDKITSSAVCAAAPGCVFCLQYPGIRVLRSTSNEDSKEASSSLLHSIKDCGDDSACIDRHRSLFAVVAPEGLGTVSYEFSGYCASDYSQSDETLLCKDNSSDSNPSALSSLWIIGVIISFAISLFVFLSSSGFVVSQ